MDRGKYFYKQDKRNRKIKYHIFSFCLSNGRMMSTPFYEASVGQSSSYVCLKQMFGRHWAKHKDMAVRLCFKIVPNNFRPNSY